MFFEITNWFALGFVTERERVRFVIKTKHFFRWQNTVESLQFCVCLWWSAQNISVDVFVDDKRKNDVTRPEEADQADEKEREDSEENQQKNGDSIAYHL